MKISKRPKSKLLTLVGVVLVLAALGGGGYAYCQMNSDQPASVVDSRQSVVPPEPDKADQPPAISETPARIMIDKIGVDAAIESVGLTEDGLMDAPNTNHGVGWYEQSSPLGGDKYSMLLDGHHGTEAVPAVFWRLHELELGDTIKVQGDGDTTLSYRVVETDQQYAKDVDMHKALYPYSKGTQSLTIITCEGLFDARNNTYDKRTIVYAERVS